jgi:hypothetical protein
MWQTILLIERELTSLVTAMDSVKVNKFCDLVNAMLPTSHIYPSGYIDEIESLLYTLRQYDGAVTIIISDGKCEFRTIWYMPVPNYSLVKER